MPITKPQYWFYKWRLLWAVRDYPLYDPPHKSSEIDMPEEKARENFDYFIRVRHQRLAILRHWMRRNFWFDLTFDPASAYRLDRWLRRYGAFLISDRRTTSESFRAYQPRWVGKYASCNVMLDIGIFVGEYVIAKRPHIRWEVYKGHEIEPATFHSIGYQRPCLAGFAGGTNPDSLSVGYWCSSNLRQRTDIGAPPQGRPGDQFIGGLKADLYLATLTEQEARTLPMKDLRHDPLE
jgi:hypothetical protein